MPKAHWSLAALLLSLTAHTCAEAQSAAGPSFPRLGLYSIGAPHNYDDVSRQEMYAKFDAVILSIWPTWSSGRSMSSEQVIRNIKSRNPNTKVFFYFANNEHDDLNDAAWPELAAKLNAERWWLYTNGFAGQRVKSTWGQTHYIFNNSNLSRRSSSGENFVEWYARYIVNNFEKTNPSVDGFYFDNMFWKPRVDGDWNGDGVTESADSADARTWSQQGLRRQVELVKQLMPGKMVIANVADWGKDEAILTDLTGIVQGGLIEHALGSQYSPERWYGWTGTMQWYRKTKAALTNPNILMFHHEGNPTNYREFRYGFATCLMDDGYYFFSAGDFHQIFWFDEFDTKLGRAISPPPTTAWQKGVYRRDFENGIVLVNPDGNAAADLELESDFRRINGRQDPGVNSGQLARTLRLASRDGVVLLRTLRRAPPAPPSNVSVE